MDTLSFAKILNETGETCGLDRNRYHDEIEKRARETRLEGETAAQSYTRVITQTPEGRELFKAYRRAPAPVQAAQDLVREKPKAAGPASEELDELARAMSKDKGISFQQAHARLQSDTNPERKALVARVRREEMEATRTVREARWPITTATREYSRG
jgi:hypothetical protein